MIFFENQGVIPFRSVDIPMPPVKPPKKESKINRVYEDDNWIIDLIGGNVRVSYFEDGHFVDEIILTGEDFKEKIVWEM